MCSATWLTERKRARREAALGMEVVPGPRREIRRYSRHHGRVTTKSPGEFFQLSSRWVGLLSAEPADGMAARVPSAIDCPIGVAASLSDTPDDATDANAARP
jgi:hypothetical protein